MSLYLNLSLLLLRCTFYIRDTNIALQQYVIDHSQLKYPRALLPLSVLPLTPRCWPYFTATLGEDKARESTYLTKIYYIHNNI